MDPELALFKELFQEPVDAEEVTADNIARERKWGLLQARVISDGGDTVYMKRLTILLTPWFSIKLHRIYRPDRDRDLHDHPWTFLSILLRGTYLEDTVDGPRLVRWWNWKRAEGRHSIKWTSRTPIWTLVFTGPKRRVWGFWVDEGTRFVSWEKYDEEKGRGDFAATAAGRCSGCDYFVPAGFLRPCDGGGSHPYRDE